MSIVIKAILCEQFELDTKHALGMNRLNLIKVQKYVLEMHSIH